MVTDTDCKLPNICFGQHTLSAVIESGYVLSVTCTSCGVHLSGQIPKDGSIPGAVTTVTHNLDDFITIKKLSEQLEQYRTAFYELYKVTGQIETIYKKATTGKVIKK